MKKIYSVLFVLFISLFIVGCDKESTSQSVSESENESKSISINDIINKIDYYIDELNSISGGEIEVDMKGNHSYSIVNLSNSQICSRDDFNDYDNNQNNIDEFSSEVILNNTIFLDEVKHHMASCDGFSNNELCTYVNEDMNYSIKVEVNGDLMNVTYYVYRKEAEKEIEWLNVVKLSLDTLEDGRIKFLNSDEVYHTNGKHRYFYYDFIEDENWITLGNWEDGSVFYNYYDAINGDSYNYNKYFSIYGIETFVSRYNPNDKIEYSINLVNDEIDSYKLNFFNDKGRLFEYNFYDINNGELSLKWNLLEADGWEYFTRNNYKKIKLYGPDGILLDDSFRIYLSLKDTGFDFLHASKKIQEEEFNDTLISLNDYGLSFDTSFVNENSIKNAVDYISENYNKFTTVDGLNMFDEDILDQIKVYNTGIDNKVDLENIMNEIKEYNDSIEEE